MEIRAAVARDPGAPFSIEQVDLGPPRDDEIIVRIIGAGLCHTDIAAYHQVLPVPLPIVLGHEGAGEVVAVGNAVTRLKVGDHVALSFASCGACTSCEQDQPGYCHSFMELNFTGARPDGSRALQQEDNPIASHFFGQSSFASHAVVNQRNAVKVRADAPLELLGPLGCGIQTGAGSIMRALNCDTGSTLLILGGGSVGLSAVLGAVVQRCQTIIVCEPHPARRDMALTLGATHVLDPAGVDLAAAVRAIIPAGVNTMLDTTGRNSVINAAVGALTHGGKMGIVAVPASAEDAVLKIDVISLLGLGYQVKGITEGDVDPQEFIPHMIDLFMAGRFPFDKLVTTYPLTEINRAIEDQHAGRCIKPVLVP